MESDVGNACPESGARATSAAVMGGTIGLTGGSVVGFALGLGGPITAVALAAGAAYSTTTDGKFGDCMRSCSDHGVQAYEKASELDRRHGVSAKIWSAGVAV